MSIESGKLKAFVAEQSRPIYLGPRGGKWADSERTRSWRPLGSPRMPRVVPSRSVKTRVGLVVNVRGIGPVTTEPVDSDDSFPPAVASYKAVDDWLVYSGRDGSHGVVVGSEEGLKRWMEEVDEQKPRAKVQEWEATKHGGSAEVEEARLAGKRVADAFELDVPLNFLVQAGADAHGESSYNSVAVVNAHLGGVQEFAGVFSGIELPAGAHIAAHEVAHSAFSSNPQIGHEFIQEVATHKAKYGALTLYHALSSDFEGAMEAASLFVNAPVEMEKRAGALFVATKRWFDFGSPR